MIRRAAEQIYFNTCMHTFLLLPVISVQRAAAVRARLGVALRAPLVDAAAVEAVAAPAELGDWLASTRHEAVERVDARWIPSGPSLAQKAEFVPF